MGNVPPSMTATSIPAVRTYPTPLPSGLRLRMFVLSVMRALQAIVSVLSSMLAFRRSDDIDGSTRSWVRPAGLDGCGLAGMHAYLGQGPIGHVTDEVPFELWATPSCPSPAQRGRFRPG